MSALTAVTPQRRFVVSPSNVASGAVLTFPRRIQRDSLCWTGAIDLGDLCPCGYVNLLWGMDIDIEDAVVVFAWPRNQGKVPLVSSLGKDGTRAQLVEQNNPVSFSWF